MPEVNLATFDLTTKSPEQLEQRRREIVGKYGPNALDKLDDMSIDDLRELAAITGALRGRTTPLSKKRAPGKKAPAKVSADELLSDL